MHDGNNPQRLLVRLVSNKVIAHGRETQRAAGEVGAAVASVGNRNKRGNGRFNSIDQPVSSVRVILCDKLPNGVKVKLCFLVERLADHRRSARRAALLARRRANTSSPGMGFTLPLASSS